MSAEFLAQLHRVHPHFRWVKLEEPMMAARVQSILDATGGEVGVLEGWGGMYMLELVAAGICGVMPGLGPADLLARTYGLAKGGRKQDAYDVFRGVLPQIVFSLQSMELYHHTEKRLLATLGIIGESVVRDLSDGSCRARRGVYRFLECQHSGAPRSPANAALSDSCALVGDRGVAGRVAGVT
ncbi:MAG TPA: hypothetical protein VKE70_26285 [Candidatus Solibacter sp.]|nr:hypothetical protein [Candidatus Solibacter sp.]